MYFLHIDACHPITPLRIINLTFIFKVKFFFVCICNTNCTMTIVDPWQIGLETHKRPPAVELLLLAVISVIDERILYILLALTL